MDVRFKTVMALPLLLLLAACSNSVLLLGPLYNQIDNRISDGILGLASFDELQAKVIRQRVQQFHHWHRRDQLPRYAALITDIATALDAGNTITAEQTQSWLDRSEALTRQFRECHPINFSTDIIRSLSAQQISQIKETIQTRRQNRRERYAQSSRDERLERRYTNAVKWAGRAGFDFNSSQKALLRTTLSQQTSLRKQYFALSDQWLNDYFAIIRNQRSADLDTRIATQLDKLWQLLESAHPEEWKKNRALWSDFTYQLIQRSDAEQKRSTSKWLKKARQYLVNNCRAAKQAGRTTLQRRLHATGGVASVRFNSGQASMLDDMRAY